MSGSLTLQDYNDLHTASAITDKKNTVCESNSAKTKVNLYFETFQEEVRKSMI